VVGTWSRARLAAVLVLVLALLTGGAPGTTATAAAQERGQRAFPGADPWEQVPRDEVAERCGLDPDLLDEVDPLLAASPVTVVRYGQLCWSAGYPTGTTGVHQVFSLTKTFGALLVGMVAARSSLDDTDLVTDWVDEDELGGINPEATIAHVLAMTATEDDLSHGEKGPWSYDTFGDREIDVLLTIMDRVIATEPDGFPGSSDTREFAQREVFDRLGMADSSWAGTSIAGTMFSTSEDLARLGLLLLRRGEWDGEQLLDERFVYRMLHPAFEDTNTGYGYLTYLNADENWAYSTGTPDATCSPYVTWPTYPHAPFFEAPDDNGGTPFADTPHDIGLAWAAGAGGQRISVHRGLDLVITVRDGALSTDPDAPGLFEGHTSVWSEIRPALVALDPVFEGDEDAFCEAYRRSVHAPDLLDPWSATASQAGPALPSGDEEAADGGASPTDEGAGTDGTEGATGAEGDGAEAAGAPPAGPARAPLPVTGGGTALLAALALGAAAALRRRS
jgi:CubicO group peptidase (beta-lactamase class C family)